MYEDAARRQRAESRGVLTDLREAVDDRGNPDAAIQKQRIECANPHQLSDQCRRPSLEVTLFEQHDGRAPRELDHGENPEQGVSVDEDVGGP